MSFNFGPDKYKKDREEMEAERRQQRIVARRKGLPDPTEPSSSDDDDDDDEEEGDEEHKGMNQYSKLMERANECLYRMELEPSRTFLKEAWELAESAEMKAEVMDTVAQTYLEDSDESAKEEAVKAFTDAESYAPNTSFERYLAMGQLANGHDSLKYYQSGVDLLISMLKELPPKKKNEDPELTAERLSLKESLSNAYCAMSDLYVTDLCDEDVAPKECERLLQEARNAMPDNPEPYRLLGNLRLIQQQPEEAGRCSLFAFKLILDAIEKQKSIPEFTSRCELAKQLFELEQWEPAAELLGMLVEESDSIAELWYLSGVSIVRMAEQSAAGGDQQENLEAAAHHLIRAQLLLQQAPDEEMETSISAQLEMLASKVNVEEIQQEVVKTMMEGLGDVLDEDEDGETKELDGTELDHLASDDDDEGVH